MLMRAYALPLSIAFSFALAGCAAPIKALLPQDGARNQAAILAREDSDSALRNALKEKAAVMLAARQAAGHGGAKAPHSAAPLRPPSGLSPQVSAMLAQARTGNAAISGERSVHPPLPARPGALASQFHVKDETRLATSPAGSPQAQGPQAMIRFAGSATELDADANRILATLTGRTGLDPSQTLVITAGLSGQAEPWERMRLAAKRLETVARHVPPPLSVERRFDPALDGGQIRLELAGGRR